MAKIRLTPHDILHETFKQKIRGYDPTAVDTFLDTVIKDYQTYHMVINQLRKENSILRKQLTNREVSSFNHTQQSQSPQKMSMNLETYEDILRRIKQLEQRTQRM